MSLSGIPPLWAPPSIRPILKPDSGAQFIDQNADRTPGSPLQALIRAVHAIRPGFDFLNINIVTDRSPIRKNLGFVCDETKPFEFGVTILGNTALFTRVERATRIPVHSGYREKFEMEHTKIASFAAGSTSHHRVVTYQFGGLNFLVRYAVDAYLEDEAIGLMKADGIEDTDVGPQVDSVNPMAT